ncbi:MAG: threonylcarbamoyl-AMP synthase [Nitrospinaceae bacterium]|jgi:L-threonylcarbamoyladenylate synthase|nr:MAG: threonylcarbamoyl-AMP synthase [Nitrospinaceae bacterium]
MTEILKVDPHDENDLAIAAAAARLVLDRGGVIAFPTDTFYGLGADPKNEAALARVFSAKGRAANKPLLVLVASPEEALDLAESLPATARKLIDALWPGPLTLVLNAKKNLPDRLTAGTGTIGLRQPGSEFTLALLRALGRPLTATSANPSGHPSPATAALCSAGVDLVLDTGPLPGGRESTILDVTVSPPRILREGAVARERIEEALGERLAPVEAAPQMRSTS